MYVQGIANFLDDLLGGFDLVAYALLVGSLAWGYLILRVGAAAGGAPDAVVAGSVRWLRRGALALALIQVLKLGTKAVVLASALGDLPWGEFFATLQVRAGLLRLAVAVVTVLLARRLAAAPRDRARWAAVTLATGVLVVVGAWLVHAVGRLEGSGPLMAVTVAHAVLAGTWVGCVLQLLFLWRLGRTDGAARAFFPEAVARFSPLGIGTVAVLVGSGVVLAVAYVGSLDGVFGTAYGSLVAAKVVLLLMALAFAGLNFTAGRQWLRTHAADGGVVTRVPFYIEAETLLLFALLFLAATVSSQPPAVDIPDRTATTREVIGMFAPRVPSLESPTHQALIAGEAGRVAVVGRVPSQAATAWSDYNHNVAGVFLLAMGVVAWLSYVPARWARWGRWWPVGFVLLSIFLFFRSDAETWPLGPIGFWESTFGNGEVLQHRLATLLAFALGAVELRARLQGPQAGRKAFIFPALCAVGGVLLVTHAHLPFEIRTDYLIQSTHLVMGLCAIVMAAARWLELRFAAAGNAAASRICGLASVTSMVAVGYILVVYNEPLY